MKYLVLATNDKTGYTLLVRLDDDGKLHKYEPFVVAWGYDPEKTGKKWCRGQYFNDIYKAVLCFKQY